MCLEKQMTSFTHASCVDQGQSITCISNYILNRAIFSFLSFALLLSFFSPRFNVHWYVYVRLPFFAWLILCIILFVQKFKQQAHLCFSMFYNIELLSFLRFKAMCLIHIIHSFAKSIVLERTLHIKKI